jgi:calcium permeable stress-gated cation channel
VKNVFLNRDCSELLGKIEERDKISKQLESAETELIVMAYKIDKKENAKKEKESKRRNPPPTDGELRTSTNEGDNGSQEDIEFECLVDKYVPKKKRPTYRLPLAKWMPSLPLIGTKVRSCCSR